MMSLPVVFVPDGQINGKESIGSGFLDKVVEIDVKNFFVKKSMTHYPSTISLVIIHHLFPNRSPRSV